MEPDTKEEKIINDTSWEAFPLFVVRSTGFPFAYLDQLRLDALLKSARQRAAARSSIARLQERFFAAVEKADRPSTPEESYRARTLVRKVRTGRAIDEATGHWGEEQLGLAGWTKAWNAAVHDRQNATEALPRLYVQSLQEARVALRRFLAYPRIREALYLLTPEILDHAARHLLERFPPNPAPNQDERKVASFLQRLCAKCDTNAFVGPIAYGTLALTFPAYLGDPFRLERRGFVAYWAVRELARAALSVNGDIADRRPRRGPAADLIELSGELKRLLAAIDGASSWRDVARKAGLPLPSRGMIERLEKSGLVWTTPPVPASEPDALQALEHALEQESPPFSEHTARTIRTLHSLAQSFAEGSVLEKSAALVQAEQLLQAAGLSQVRRGAGEIYTDRLALYEEDYDGTRAQRLSTQATTALCSTLAPALDIAAAITASALNVVREQTCSDFEKTFPGEEHVPLPRFLKHLPLSRPVDVQALPVTCALTTLVAEQWDAQKQEVSLPLKELERVLAPFAPDREEPLLASPDVFLAASSEADLAAGTLDVVLGEIHWGLQLLGNLCCFVEDQPTLLEEVRAWLAPHAHTQELVNVALGQRFGKMCFLEIFPRTLELSGPASSRSRIIRPGDLSVDHTGRLHLIATGEPIRLFSGDTDGLVYTPFAPPALRLPTLRLGSFTPRIRVGRLILQRATWWLEAQDLVNMRTLPAQDQYTALVELFERLHIPDRVFVHLEHEPKPLYVDIGSPHLVSLLLSAARTGIVKITEMLPDPTMLWLKSADGLHPCEFRLLFRYSGARLHSL